MGHEGTRTRRWALRAGMALAVLTWSLDSPAESCDESQPPFELRTETLPENAVLMLDGDPWSKTPVFVDGVAGKLVEAELPLRNGVSVHVVPTPRAGDEVEVGHATVPVVGADFVPPRFDDFHFDLDDHPRLVVGGGACSGIRARDVDATFHLRFDGASFGEDDVVIATLRDRSGAALVVEEAVYAEGTATVGVAEYALLGTPLTEVTVEVLVTDGSGNRAGPVSADAPCHVAYPASDEEPVFVQMDDGVCSTPAPEIVVAAGPADERASQCAVSAVGVAPDSPDVGWLLFGLLWLRRGRRRGADDRVTLR